MASSPRSAANRVRVPPVGLLTPLPPEETGVADYSADLLPALATRVATEVYTRDPSLSREHGSVEATLRRYRELLSAPAGHLPVYQIGNHYRYHGEIYDLALTRPGLVVLHEYGLHDLVRDAALARGGFSAYAEELRYCLGRTGERLATGLRLDPNGAAHRLSPWAWPLFERLVDSSRALVVHSRSAEQRIAASRPTARVHVVPHPIPATVPVDDEVRSLRRELGLGEETLVVGAFGAASEAKRLDLVMRAFDRLSDGRRDCALLLVGPGTRRFVSESGLAPGPAGSRIHQLDRVPLERLVAAMAVADVAFNLRDPTAGEASGTCLRLLALGKPVIVSDVGWFREIPDDCCIRIRPGAGQAAAIDAFLEALAGSAGLRRGLGAAGRRWALRHHAMEATVEGYREAVLAAAAAPCPKPPAPPLAPWQPDDVACELIVELTAALGDLGVSETDEDVLEGVAGELEGLGLGPG